MTRPTLSPRDRLVFALDVPDIAEVRRLVSLLRDHVGMFKVGLELFISQGPAVVRDIQALTQGQTGLFLDLKLHDIPNTVRGAMAAASRLGADLVNVHAGDGIEILRAAKEAAGQTKVLAVTVLTSVDLVKGESLGLAPAYTRPQALARLRAEQAKEAGLDGVVCSGQEAQAMRQVLGPEAIVLTPGIRPAWSVVASEDQSRVVTPAQAVQAGADYLVVGRPIRTAPDPAEAADKVVEEIATAMASA